MAKMSRNEYDRYKEIIQSFYYGSDSSQDAKARLQRVYDEIFYSYDDGRECLEMLDKYQRKWTMNLH